MIIIIRSNSIDITSEDLFLWANNFPDIKAKILNFDIVLRYGKLFASIENNSILLNDIKVDDIDCLLIRRLINYRDLVNNIIKDLEVSNDTVVELGIRLRNEISKFMEYLAYRLNKGVPNQIPNISKLSTNKLINLEIAKSLGFLTPDSLLTNNKDDLLKFYKKNKGRVITKPIFETPNYNEQNKFFTFKTTMICEDTISQNVENNFFLSFFQNQIDKWIEIRVFVYFDKLWAMAIFSQSDQKTSLDYRNYNLKNPNRTVPFLLPENIRMKVMEFMNNVNLNTGSIDLILTKEQKYYFLEVNPVGQFGNLSMVCNYQIEKQIINRINGNVY